MAIEILYSNATPGISVTIDSSTTSSVAEIGAQSSVVTSVYTEGDNPTPIHVAYSTVTPMSIKTTNAESTVGISNSGMLTFGLSLTDTEYNSISDSEITLNNLYIDPSSGLQLGDMVMFVASNQSEYSEYGVQLEKVNTNSVARGATSPLFILKSTSANRTILMAKGVYDYDSNDNRVTWVAGYTLYAASTMMAIAPSALPGHWVKSIGYCLPNNINKKRVWFNPDSTYIQRT